MVATMSTEEHADDQETSNPLKLQAVRSVGGDRRIGSRAGYGVQQRSPVSEPDEHDEHEQWFRWRESRMHQRGRLRHEQRLQDLRVHRGELRFHQRA